jgi:hypothetical protein
MREDDILYYLSEWAIAAVLLVLLLGSMELGRRYGRRDHDRFDTNEEDSASLSGASLGLLALLLAFTYAVSLNHFDLRKQVLLKESNAIGTAYLRSDFLPEPQREELQGLLRRYTDVRVGFSDAGLDPARYVEMLRETDRLHAELWSSVRRAMAERTPTTLDALLVDALNGVIDVHAERLRAQRDHVPQAVLFLLAVVAAASVGLLGYAAGRKGDRRQWLRALLPVMIVAVITLIIDLDRPRSGLVQISQQPLLDLQASLRAAQLPAANGK